MSEAAEHYRITQAGVKDIEKDIFQHPDSETAHDEYHRLRKTNSRKHVTFRLYRGGTLLRTAGTALTRHSLAKARNPL